MDYHEAFKNNQSEKPQNSADVADIRLQVEQFAGALFEPGDVVELRPLPSGLSSWHRASELASHVTTLAADNATGEHIYVGANPRPRHGARGDAAITTARCVFVDIDNVTLAEGQQRLADSKLPPPTAVVFSGHGVWGFWRLLDPMTDLVEWRQLQQDLARLLGSDTTVCNSERITRLPGFINHKEPVAESYLAECHPERRYDVVELQEKIPTREDTTPPPANTNGRHVGGKGKPPPRTAAVDNRVERAERYINAMPPATSGSGGHAATLCVACECFRFGLGDTEASQLLHTYNRRCSPAWSDAELMHKLKDASELIRGAGEFGSRLTEERTADVFNLTDLGNAGRFEKQHRHVSRHCQVLGRWFIWDGKRWKFDTTNSVKRLGRDVIRTMWLALPKITDPDKRAAFFRWTNKLESTDRLTAMIGLAASEESIAIEADVLDNQPWLFNSDNGTINLRTGLIQPHNSGDLITKIGGTSFDPNATAPQWLAFLDRIMSGNEPLIAYLQRVAGLCLTGVNSVQELFILHGEGSNGKSTFCDTLAGILGDYAAEAPESLMIERNHSEHPTETAGLMGSRAVFSSENEAGAKLKLQRIKKLTGEGHVTTRFMRGDYFKFRREFKLIMCTNNRPKIDENTEAAWRRIRLIPFNVVIPTGERDTTLGDKLKTEWPGILAWAVRGCLDWQRNGMNPPPEVLAATSDYRAESDPLADFINDRLILGQEFRATRPDLWAEFQSFHAATKEKLSLDRAGLFDRIRRVANVTESAWRVDGKIARGFEGIGVCRGKPPVTEVNDYV